MDKILLVILTYLLSLNNFSGQVLSCLIQSDKLVYLAKDIKAHKYPNITITFKNNSDSIIYIVSGLDGSNQAKRFPFAYFNIHLLGDTSRRDNSGGCGNYSDLDSNAFIRLRPGQTVTPEFFDHLLYNQKTFTRKGKYLISFYYSTNEPNIKKWMGDPFLGQQNKWFDRQTGNILPEYKDKYESLLILFNKVPKTELTSNELTIEIK